MYGAGRRVRPRVGVTGEIKVPMFRLECLYWEAITIRASSISVYVGY